jgi:proteasome accessory factor B
LPARPRFDRKQKIGQICLVASWLHDHKRGLTAREIAEKLEVSPRTVQRLIRLLESDLELAIQTDGPRYRIGGDTFLPPLNLDLYEGVALYLAGRLLARFQGRYDPGSFTAFQKLAGVMPPAIKQHMLDAIESLVARARDPRQTDVFRAIARAWSQSTQVRIGYPDSDNVVRDRVVEPWFLEPNPTGRGCYLIGRDVGTDASRTFRLERIARAEALASEFFTQELSPRAHLQNAWTISNEPEIEIKLRFYTAPVVERLTTLHLHVEHRLSVGPDDTADLTLRVRGLTEIKSWILGWGDTVEVLDPPELRRTIASSVTGAAARYSPHPPA